MRQLNADVFTSRMRRTRWEALDASLKYRLDRLGTTVIATASGGVSVHPKRDEHVPSRLWAPLEARGYRRFAGHPEFFRRFAQAKEMADEILALRALAAGAKVTEAPPSRSRPLRHRPERALEFFQLLRKRRLDQRSASFVWPSVTGRRSMPVFALLLIANTRCIWQLDVTLSGRQRQARAAVDACLRAARVSGSWHEVASRWCWHTHGRVRELAVTRHWLEDMVGAVSAVVVAT